MNHLITELPGWVITTIFGLIGVGIGWGVVKSEIRHIKDRQDKQDRKVDLIVGKEVCNTYREECRNAIRGQIAEIKDAVENNRTIVLERFDELKEFMGYVKGKIEDYNGRLMK